MVKKVPARIAQKRVRRIFAGSSQDILTGFPLPVKNCFNGLTANPQRTDLMPSETGPIAACPDAFLRSSIPSSGPAGSACRSRFQPAFDWD